MQNDTTGRTYTDWNERACLQYTLHPPRFDGVPGFKDPFSSVRDFVSPFFIVDSYSRANLLVSGCAEQMYLACLNETLCAWIRAQSL